MKYMYDPDEAAGFVTDRSAVQQLYELMAENPHAVEHACGYHWLICFRDASGSVRVFAHNQDCEKYQKQNRRVNSVLQTYFNQIRAKPTAFVFNVRVPASLTPQEIVSRTSTYPPVVFFLNGTDSRLPAVRIEVTTKSPIPENKNDWDSATEANRTNALKRLAEVVAGAERLSRSVHHSRFENRFSSFGGGQIEDRAETTLYLPYGQLPSELKLPPDVTVLERIQPQSYVVQVLATARSPLAVKQELERLLGVPVAVSPYPDDPGSQPNSA